MTLEMDTLDMIGGSAPRPTASNLEQVQAIIDGIHRLCVSTDRCLAVCDIASAREHLAKLDAKVSRLDATLDDLHHQRTESYRGN